MSKRTPAACLLPAAYLLVGLLTLAGCGGGSNESTATSNNSSNLSHQSSLASSTTLSLAEQTLGIDNLPPDSSDSKAVILSAEEQSPELNNSNLKASDFPSL